MEINTAFLPTDEVIFSSSSSSSSPKNSKEMMTMMMLQSFSTCEEKAQAIRDCLQGTLGSENVDLWQLRQLALLPGGLLSPSLRKSAWTKLTGLSDAVLWTPQNGNVDDNNVNAVSNSYSNSNSNNRSTETYKLSNEETQALQNEVAKNVRQIEQMLSLQKEDSKEISGKQEEEFWFPPMQQALNNATRRDSSSQKPGLLPSPTSYVSDHTSHTDEDFSSSHQHDDSIKTSQVSLHKEKSNIFHNVPSSAFQFSSSEYAKTLEQVITDVLEQSPNSHYTSGLASIASMMMINLESPALASHMLAQVVSYPLHHVVATGKDSTGMTELLCRLVEHFHLPLNCDLYRVARHAMAWFTLPNKSVPQHQAIPMISRLVDVFLVSHPLFPLYVGAASLVRRGTLRTMDAVEEAIQTGMSFMERLPPSELLAMSHGTLDLIIPHTPAWTLAASAPTDWALLETLHEEEHVDLPCFPASPTSSPTRRTGVTTQQQQDHSFDTTEDDSKWEQLSVISSANSNHELSQEEPVFAGAPNANEPQATQFYDCYPLAIIAAGLAVASKSAGSSTKANACSGVLRFAVLVTTLIVCVVAYLQGFPQIPIASEAKCKLPSADVSMPSISTSHLVPNVPKAGWTFLVSNVDNSGKKGRNTEQELPAMEQMLHEYMFEGPKKTMEDWNTTAEEEKALLLPARRPLKLLQPIARKVKHITGLWKKIVSRVFRRKSQNKSKVS